MNAVLFYFAIALLILYIWNYEQSRTFFWVLFSWAPLALYLGLRECKNLLSKFLFRHLFGFLLLAYFFPSYFTLFYMHSMNINQRLVLQELPLENLMHQDEDRYQLDQNQMKQFEENQQNFKEK